MASGRKRSSSQDKADFEVYYVPVFQTRFNSVYIEFPISTTPYFMYCFRCKSEPIVADPNPLDSALAACILQSFSDFAVVFKNTKNQPLEIKHLVYYGRLCVSFGLPSAMSSVTACLKIIKKSISSKLVTNAFKVLVSVHKDFKYKKEAVQNTMINKIMKNVKVKVFGKKDLKGEDKEQFVQRIRRALPKAIKGTGSGSVPTTPQIPKLDELYKKMHQTDRMPDEFRAVLVAALQSANFDFFTTPDTRDIYVANRYCVPAHINVIKQFMNSRFKAFVTGSKVKEDLLERKIFQMFYLVYQYAACPINLYPLVRNFKDFDYYKRYKAFLEDLPSRF